jgi:flagellar hook-associated protein 2
VTFQLLAPSPVTGGTAETVQVVIANDTSSVSSALNTFVNDYNTVIQAITAQEGDTSSGTPEPLYGSPVLAQLQEQLQSALSAEYSNSGSITSLTDLGVEANQDGTLTIDSDTLSSALNGNYSDVSDFFQNGDSFGSALTSALNNLGSSSPTGTLSLALADDKSEETDLNTQVTNESTAIAAEKQSLTTELNTANEELEAIPEQIQEVNELYSAITGYNENPS